MRLALSAMLGQIADMLPQTHLPLDHPRAQEFLDRHFPGKLVVQVPLTGNMQPGQCYRNVRTMIQAHGGTAQTGWVLTHFPDHYIEAFHHAVWRAPYNALEDVTGPAFPPMGRTPVAFIEDDPRIGLGNIDPNVPSIFLQLDLAAGTKDYIDLTRRRTSLSAQIKTLVATVPHRVMPNGSFEITEGQIGAEAYARLTRQYGQLSAAMKAANDRRNLYVPRLNRGDFSYLS